MTNTPSFFNVPGAGSSGREAISSWEQAHHTAMPPLHAEVRPISERQFEAAVQGFRRDKTHKGIRYWKEGQPWAFIREGNRVTVQHRMQPRPGRYYELV